MRFRRSRMWLLGIGFSLLQSTAFAASVGQWASNGDVWSASSNYSTIYAGATVAGHRFDPTAEGISQQSLAGNTHFIVSQPAAAATQNEAASLGTWVRSGGTLVMFANPEAGAYSTYTSYFANALLSGIGSSMSVMSQSFGLGGTQVLGTLGGSDGAVSGIQGSGLASGSIFPILGGNSLAVSGALLPYLVRYEQLGSGKVYLIGGNIAANSLIAEGANRQFLLNLLNQGNFGTGFAGETPEPSTILLTGLGFVGAVLLRRKRKI